MYILWTEYHVILHEYITFSILLILKCLLKINEQSLPTTLRKLGKWHYPNFTGRKDTILRSKLSCLRSHTRREQLHRIKQIHLNPCRVSQSQDCPSLLFYNKFLFHCLPFQKFYCQYRLFCGSHIVWHYLWRKLEKLLVICFRAAMALQYGGLFLPLNQWVSFWQFKHRLLTCWGERSMH